MKTIKLTALFLCGAILVSFTPTNKPAMALSAFAIPSSVQWKSASIDLGEIAAGKPVTVEFEFTNTGRESVIVSDAKASCGCTVASFPKEPVAAGKTAKITAVFNAATKGAFSKNVTVSILNEEAKVLTFTGTVI